ncbi:MAG: molybdenum cofactor guanylyltransferase [Salinisphaera sp.]|nr:molybdenum cofactor guanylyltransferase [Salinisphaera sp.]
MPELPRASITGAILAGGEGRRMGGVDKGLVDLCARPLVGWTLEALRPQVGAVIINANRSLHLYRAFGFPVVSDAGEGHQGPLAGMLAALTAARTEFVLTVPCDAPRLPPDLSARLGRSLLAADAEIAVVRANGRLQPVHALMRRNLKQPLAEALAAGERKVAGWLTTRRCAEVNCDDIADAFVNVNTPEQRDELVALLAREHT